MNKKDTGHPLHKAEESDVIKAARITRKGTIIAPVLGSLIIIMAGAYWNTRPSAEPEVPLTPSPSPSPVLTSSPSMGEKNRGTKANPPSKQPHKPTPPTNKEKTIPSASPPQTIDEIMDKATPMPIPPKL